MSGKKEITKLTRQFQSLGLRKEDAESAAQMQFDGGGSPYAQLAFLHGAWSTVVREGDREWMDGLIERASESPDEPGAGAGLALKRLLAAGASPEDLTELVRVMQWQTLQSVCYQLADYSSVDYPEEDMPRAKWSLMELDENDQPTEELSGLHDLLLATEPSGREMRPKQN